MDLLLDILQGLGVAAAVGLRPFLAALTVCAMALADLGVDFEGTAYDFYESPVTLGVLGALLIASLLPIRRPGNDVVVLVASVLLAGSLFAGTLDDRQDTWWYGYPLGIAVALAAGAVARQVFDRVRTRLTKGGDDSAAATLPLYAELLAGLAAILSVALPPVGLVLVVLVVWLGFQQRRRGDEKYAGLRILR